MREGEQKDGVGAQHGKWGDCHHVYKEYLTSNPNYCAKALLQCFP